MYEEDYRCWTCDSRWCQGECQNPGWVYVVCYGWASPQAAALLEQQGRTVHWNEVAPVPR